MVNGLKEGARKMDEFFTFGAPYHQVARGFKGIQPPAKAVEGSARTMQMLGEDWRQHTKAVAAAIKAGGPPPPPPPPPSPDEIRRRLGL